MLELRDNIKTREFIDWKKIIQKLLGKHQANKIFLYLLSHHGTSIDVILLIGGKGACGGAPNLDQSCGTIIQGGMVGVASCKVLNFLIQ